MSRSREVSYTFDVSLARKGREKPPFSSNQPAEGDSLSRIARLMALAIRFEGLLREERIRDCAELARLGRVTRARITQIMQLLHLAPDIQEQILFLPPLKGLTERNLRPIVSKVNWCDQRRMFHEITQCLDKAGDQT